MQFWTTAEWVEVASAASAAKCKFRTSKLELSFKADATCLANYC